MTPQPGTAVPTPLYPPPPYSYDNAQLYACGYPLDSAAVAAVLPECLEVPIPDENGEHMCALVLARYPESTLGSYDELYWLVPAQFGEERGFYCPLMYLTNDTAMAAGREVWGFPKRLATIEWTSVEGRQQVLLSRSEKLLMSIRFECTEAYAVNTEDSEAPRIPIYNLRHMPAVGPGHVESTYLTATFVKQKDRERSIGLATVRMGSVENETLAKLAPSIRRLPVVHTAADVTLPPVDIAHAISI